MSAKSLEGKNAVVTGAGRDIGRAVALRLGAEGANVVVNFLRSETEAREVQSRIRDSGAEAVRVQADVSTSQGVADLVRQAVEAFGSVDILVNNAGGLVDRVKLMDMEEELWDAVMALNFKSAFMLAQAVKPHMPSGGSMVNIGSAAARSGGGPGAGAYAAGKGGLLTLTRALAKELAGENIRVNVVEPGLIDTRFHAQTDPGMLKKWAQGVPLGRMGTPEDVAGAVSFLAGNDAAYITGEAIQVNGGLAFV